MSPLRGLRLLAICVYRDAEETPKQINPTGLKNMSVSLKLTPMVRLGNRTYQPRENEPTLFKHPQRADDSQ